MAIKGVFFAKKYIHGYKILNIFSLAALALSAVFCLTGCRDYKAPTPPYEQWQPAAKPSKTPTPDKVWQGIRGRVPDGKGPFSLAGLLDTAFYNSPITSKSWHDIKSKRALLGQAKSGLMPRVSVSAEGAREKSVPNTASGKENQLKYGPSGKAELLLFDFGGRNASIEAAYQDMLSAGYAFNQSLQDLILDVQKSYYGLFSAYSTLQSAESNLVDANKGFEAADLKFQTGIASKLDKLQAEASRDRSLYELEDAKGRLKQAKAELAIAVGFSADTDFDITAPAQEASFKMQESDIKEMIDEALSCRPDIASARALVNEKKARIKQASSALFPEINAGGAYGHDWYKYYNEKPARDNGYSYSGYLSVNWDIFDGFYNFNKKLQAEAEFGAQTDKLIRLELEASADVWKKYFNYNTAVKKLEYGKAYLDSSTASHELALEGYSHGIRSMLDLLQAQSELSNARARYVDSQRQAFVAIAELAHATGSLKAGTPPEKEAP
ncbi:MAG: TolC family protein [Candidatus Omnitrophica bacterium]|nr:TolC family protein [Candidatus Omnitrophota bacterium]